MNYVLNDIHLIRYIKLYMDHSYNNYIRSFEKQTITTHFDCAKFFSATTSIQNVPITICEKKPTKFWHIPIPYSISAGETNARQFWTQVWRHIYKLAKARIITASLGPTRINPVIYAFPKCPKIKQEQASDAFKAAPRASRDRSLFLNYFEWMESSSVSGLDMVWWVSMATVC